MSCPFDFCVIILWLGSNLKEKGFVCGILSTDNLKVAKSVSDLVEYPVAPIFAQAMSIAIFCPSVVTDFVGQFQSPDFSIT